MIQRAYCVIQQAQKNTASNSKLMVKTDSKLKREYLKAEK